MWELVVDAGFRALGILFLAEKLCAHGVLFLTLGSGTMQILGIFI
jgi:hypothetical protein